MSHCMNMTKDVAWKRWDQELKSYGYGKLRGKKVLLHNDLTLSFMQSYPKIVGSFLQISDYKKQQDIRFKKHEYEYLPIKVDSN